MQRVLVTGGAGAIGAAVVRRLLGDPDFEVRVSDRRPVPDWVREGCSVHTGDLRDPAEASRAMRGCTHVVHAAPPDADAGPYTLVETGRAVGDALVRAAIEQQPERFVAVSSALVFEQAERFPTPEAHLAECAPPRSARGWAALAGERACRAAHDEHGLRFTICRPFGPYGPEAVPELLRGSLRAQRPLPLPATGARTCTPTHVTDVAGGILAALSHPAGEGEDFNLGAREELTVAQVARLCWEAAGNDDADLTLAEPERPAGGAPRCVPCVEKAERLLDWSARIGVREGLAQTVAAVRRRTAA
jgi:nucleoside-diphosphate-sugar epimerase